MKTRLLRVNAIRALEAAHHEHSPSSSLMMRAAHAAARAAEDLCVNGGRILVLAGPGNNGGDAWVTARLLQSRWYRVTILTQGKPAADEAQVAHQEFLTSGGVVAQDWPTHQHDLIIDGLLGIGISRPPEDKLAAWIDQANLAGCPILALDVPSGLDADTGICLGAGIRATRTVTFVADKPGLHTASGVDHAGAVEVAALDIDPEVADATLGRIGVESQGWLIPANSGPPGLPRRRRDTHKGRFGSVGVVGASRGMVGAGLLAARAALYAGAGKVFFAPLDESSGGLDWLHPEIMFRRPRDLLEGADLTAVVLGPGLGTSDGARGLVEIGLKLTYALVLDADALNLIARGRALQTALKRRQDHGHLTVLTPHPAEAARLLGVQATEVNADRITAACRLAARLGAIVVLKGAGSIIAAPDGSWAINESGNPGMASAGMGDVLAGVLGGLLAQREESDLAALDLVELGVWSHGSAADDCVDAGHGPLGLTASEVVLACRARLNGMVQRS